MALRVRFTIFHPRIWIMAAVFLLMAAAGLNYYQDQLDATRALAMKHGLPDAVAVEDFDPERNSNDLNEVRFVARVRPSDIALVEAADGTPYHLIPLFASSDQAFPSRSPAKAYYLVRAKDGEDPIAALGLGAVERAGAATLVELTGTQIVGQAVLRGTDHSRLRAAFGLGPDAVLVAAGLLERNAVLGYRNIAPYRDALVALALALIGVAGLSSFFGKREIKLGRQEERAIQTPTSRRASRAFQPLASQDELFRSDEAERLKRRRSHLRLSAGFTDQAEILRSPR